jgi:hypothetical protein
MNKYFIYAMLILFPGVMPAADDTIRCGNKIVRTGMTTADILKYCGEPSSKEVEEHAVRSGNRVTGTTQLNLWTYKRGFGGKPVVFEFDQDKLLSIKRLP